MNRRSLVAALAALPFAGKAEAATVPDPWHHALEATRSIFEAKPNGPYHWVMTPTTWRAIEPRFEGSLRGFWWGDQGVSAVRIETDFGSLTVHLDSMMTEGDILVGRGPSPAAPTVQDIHQLRPFIINAGEREGVLKAAAVEFIGVGHASLLGKVYGFYGTPLTCTNEAAFSGTDGMPPGYVAYFEEINL